MIELKENAEIDAIKKKIIREILSKEALERLNRIRLIKPELANQLEAYLLQLYQEGKLRKALSEEEIKTILSMMANKKSFKIIR